MSEVSWSGLQVSRRNLVFVKSRLHVKNILTCPIGIPIHKVLTYCYLRVHCARVGSKKWLYYKKVHHHCVMLQCTRTWARIILTQLCAEKRNKSVSRSHAKGRFCLGPKFFVAAILLLASILFWCRRNVSIIDSPHGQSCTIPANCDCISRTQELHWSNYAEQFVCSVWGAEETVYVHCWYAFWHIYRARHDPKLNANMIDEERFDLDIGELV